MAETRNWNAARRVIVAMNLHAHQKFALGALLMLSLPACSNSDPQTVPRDGKPTTAPAPAGPVTNEMTDAEGGPQDPLPQDEGERRATKAPEGQTIPVRFHGTYGENLNACTQRSHANFTVMADKIDFFESNAELVSVRVDGDYAAASVTEAYADQTREYVFYMALDGPEGLRFRYDKGEREFWVRCP